MKHTKIKAILFTNIFGGFYEGLAYEQCDYELEYELEHEIDIDYKFDDIKYLTKFVDLLADQFKLKMKFESLFSPREYNFTTDTITVTLTRASYMKVFKYCMKPSKIKKFDKFLKRYFTSHPGFHSFYPNSVEEMYKYREHPSILAYDENQVGALLSFYLEDKFEPSEEGCSLEYYHLHIAGDLLIYLREQCLTFTTNIKEEVS